jgi:hypothetical protein
MIPAIISMIPTIIIKAAGVRGNMFAIAGSYIRIPLRKYIRELVKAATIGTIPKVYFRMLNVGIRDALK